MKAGCLYFAVVFAFAFLFGTIRALFLSDAIGAIPAVLIEMPLVLLLSWLVAGRLVRAFGLEAALARLGMGLVAFLILQLAETLLAGILGQSSFMENASGYLSFVTDASRIGLAAQIMFAFIPLLVAARTSS